MSIEGLWAVEFGHAGAAFQAINAGIVVLETGRAFGGDTWFAYTGDYQNAGNGISGSLKVNRHHHDGQSIDAWETGEDTFNVEFAVTWVANGSLAQGTMTRNGVSLGLRLRKLAELP